MAIGVPRLGDDDSGGSWVYCSDGEEGAGGELLISLRKASISIIKIKRGNEKRVSWKKEIKRQIANATNHHV